MRRVVRFAVLVLAILYFMVDAVFLNIATPLARWMGRQKVLVGVRKWIVALAPYPSLALFAVPVVVLEPVKPMAVYLIGTGRIATGIAVLVVGELIKLVIVERLFKLCRRKLLRIPVFAWAYGYWRQGVDWIVAMPAWQAARRWIVKHRRRSRHLIARVKSSSPYRLLSRHLAVVIAPKQAGRRAHALTTFPIATIGRRRSSTQPPMPKRLLP